MQERHTVDINGETKQIEIAYSGVPGRSQWNVLTDGVPFSCVFMPSGWTPSEQRVNGIKAL